MQATKNIKTAQIWTKKEQHQRRKKKTLTIERKEKTVPKWKSKEKGVKQHAKIELHTVPKNCHL